MKTICLSLTAGVLLSAMPGKRSAMERTWDVGAWAEVASLRDVKATHLINPQRIVACARHLVVLDFADPHVSAFDGHMFQWRFGREGSGPQEFRTPGSVSCDARGRLWVPDQANGRIQIVSNTGRLLSSLPTLLPIRRLAVAPSGTTAWALTTSAKELALRLDDRARRTMDVALPSWLAKYNALQREAFIASAPDGGAVIAFRWASVIVRIAPSGAVDTLRGSPESIAFPEFRAYKTDDGTGTIMRIHPGASEATRGVYVAGDTINVLAVDQGDAALTIIDRYGLNGKYLGSRRLPRAVRSAAAIGPDAYVLIQDPVPSLVRLRWNSARPRK